MAKPSIFSKDYERRMKKRKRSVMIIIILVLVALLIIVFNSKIKNLDFTNIKANIQAWVDSDKPEEKTETQEEAKELEEKPEVEEKEPEKLYVDINVAEGITVKAEYVEEAGIRKFVEVTPIEGYTFNISPSKEKILILDNAQNMKVSDARGNVIDITKMSYVSQAGTTFPKDTILQSNPSYLWHSQAKFIDEDNVVYVSELPYFGNGGAKKYVWIHNISSNTDRTIWNFVGPDIVVGDLVPEKGITITLSGAVYYLNSEGVVVQ
ncbi:MAG: hypothetical protein E7214_11870 [Clostridium sp.]|nr:hypothetical protein [Clostridium sp.]